jgi:hypothetical protein
MGTTAAHGSCQDISFMGPAALPFFFLFWKIQELPSTHLKAPGAGGMPVEDIVLKEILHVLCRGSIPERMP